MSVILGLGSNIGDRLNYLRLAVDKIAAANINIEAISPVYISDALLPDHAPLDWNQPYLNIAIRCQTQLTPQALLSFLKEIEASCGREKNHPYWGPRVIDIDILAWDDLVIHSEELTIPHKHLLDRPFALWPLADVIPYWAHPLTADKKSAAELVAPWGSRLTGEAPYHTKQIAQQIKGPQLIGILNITPNSFTDGGCYLDPKVAVAKARELIAQGAEIIDIGAESTAPLSEAIDWQEEWQRLEPVLALLQQEKQQFLLPPIISIDTRHAETAQRALQYGVQWINDVSGFDQEAMRQVALNSDARLVVMHHLSVPERRSDAMPRNIDPVALVLSWAEKRIAALVALGINKNRIIFDPGLGFGKLPEHSREIIKRIKEFTVLGVDLYIGHSRKNFWSLLDRDLETATISLSLAQQPVKYLRVHNVELNAHMLKIFKG